MKTMTATTPPITAWSTLDEVDMAVGSARERDTGTHSETAKQRDRETGRERERERERHGDTQ